MAKLFQSLVVVLAFAIGTQLAVLPVNAQALVTLLDRSPFLQLLDWVGGTACRHQSMFTISVLFIVAGRIAAGLITLRRPLGSPILPSKRISVELGIGALSVLTLTYWFIQAGVLPSGEYAVLTFIGIALLGVGVLEAIVSLLDKVDAVDSLLALFAAGLAISTVSSIFFLPGEFMAGPTSIPLKLPAALFTLAFLVPLRHFGTFGRSITPLLAAPFTLARYKSEARIESADRTSTRHPYDRPPMTIAEPHSPFWVGRHVEALLVVVVAYVIHVMVLYASRDGWNLLRALGTVGGALSVYVCYAWLLLSLNDASPVWSGVAHRMKLGGRYIPGIRPGENTERYLASKARRSVSASVAYTVVALACGEVASILTGSHLHSLVFLAPWAGIEAADRMLQPWHTDVLARGGRWPLQKRRFRRW